MKQYIYSYMHVRKFGNKIYILVTIFTEISTFLPNPNASLSPQS